jgi:hypothetical protein
MDKFSRKAKFESVKFDKDALTFHASKYIAGAVYPLAKQCYQFVQLSNNRNSYQIFLDQSEGNFVSNIEL